MSSGFKVSTNTHKRRAVYWRGINGVFNVFRDWCDIALDDDKVRGQIINGK
jgi:hypothetical protein